MLKHYIVYEGVYVALAVMHKGYIGPLMSWINNPKTTAGVLTTPPVTYEAEIAWIEGLAKRGDTDVVLAILIREGKNWRYIGHTGIHRMTWPDARGSTGSFIGDASVHGKGIGTEAKLLLLNNAILVLALRKITSEVKAFNGNSLGHLLRCGYRIVGVRKEQHFYQGQYVDEILLETFRNDFMPIWEHYQEAGALPGLTEAQRELIKKYSGEK